MGGVFGLALLQLSDRIDPDIPPLPKPAAHERLLFEDPSVALLVLLAVAVIAPIALGTRGKLRVGLAVAGGAAVLAGAIFGVARGVTTERERLLARAERLVRAVAGAERSSLWELLDQDARLAEARIVGLGGGLDREGIVDAVERQFGEGAGFGAVRIEERQAVVDGPNSARTQLAVSAEGGDFGRIGSWWAVDWRRDADGAWRVMRIRPLFIGGVLPYSP